MAEITNIVKSGKDKYSVYIDNEFSCFLTSETIVKNSFKIGQFIDQSQIETAQFENEKLTAFDRAIKYLSAIKSEKQVKDYLYSKGYGKKIVDFVINKLKEYNYVNDEIFAKMYIQNYQTKKGKKLLTFELETKGISKEIISNLLEDFDDNLECMRLLAEKFLRNKPRDKKTAIKLSNHLFSKGYTYDKINIILKEFIYNFEDEEN